MEQPTITFTRESLAAFKREYDLAIKNGQEQFKFEGHDFHFLYAKYLIEYVEGQLSGKHVLALGRVQS